MSFTRTQDGDRVVLDRNGAQVEIGPDPYPGYEDTHIAITLNSMFRNRELTFGFDAEELAMLIDELDLAYDRLVDNGYLDACRAEGLSHDQRSQVDDWRDRPIGKTVSYAYGQGTGEDERLRNRIVVPFQVGELLEMVDGLQPEDVLEVRVPIG